MIEDVGSWQFGVEMHLPDVDSTTALPAGWMWSLGCHTIVNSDGLAIDPAREFTTRGGALLSPQFPSPARLVAELEPLLQRLPHTPNHRCDLYVNVTVPGLDADVEAVKKMADYTRRFLPSLLPGVDPIDFLAETGMPPATYKAARTYRQMVALRRHYMVSPARHEFRMRATGVHGFLTSEFASETAHTPAEALNFRPLRMTRQVQLRCFAHPREMSQLHAAALFTRDWLNGALTGRDPVLIASQWVKQLPRQMPFDHRLESGWLLTNVHTNTRRAVAARLLRAERAQRSSG